MSIDSDVDVIAAPALTACTFLVDDPRRTAAWDRASDGQQRLSLHLNWALSEYATVLHDRKVTGSRGGIDHLVVGPTGIWVIDARSQGGTVEQREVVVDGVTSNRLFVSGCDETAIVRDIGWQISAVRRVLEPIGFGGAPISSAVCFTDADWPFFAKPFQINGAWVTWAKRLTDSMLSQQLFSNEAIEIVSEQLDSQLPPAA